jgi:hypothetical protein
MTLEVNGQKLEFSFGLGFLGELLEDLNKSIDEVLVGFNENPYKYIPTAMYVSYRYSKQRNGEDFVTKYEFFDWIDNDGGLTDKNKSAVKFITKFTQSLFKDVPKDDIDEVKEDASKKK